VIVAFELSAILTFAASLMAANLQGDLYIFSNSRFSDATRRFWIKVLDRLILGFSDQQLVTGISIIVIGYIELCAISTYHFYVIQTLAMFSCSAHLASVTSLRRYFQYHRTVARLRILLMLLFAVLLSTALLMIGISLRKGRSPVSDSSSLPASQCPMLCSLEVHDGLTIDRITGIAMILLLLCSYWSALAYVFPDANVVFTMWLLTRPLITIEAILQAIPGGRYGYQFHERFMHSRLWFPSLNVTFVCQTIWWMVSFAFSIVIRAIVRPQQNASGGDWSFGQILALLMMALPFLGAIEVFFGNSQITVLICRVSELMG
jgi:hypothetical protein